MSDLSDREIRLRCIEAAARAPILHKDGAAAGVLEVAQKWAGWVLDGKAGPLGLPKK